MIKGEVKEECPICLIENKLIPSLFEFIENPVFTMLLFPRTLEYLF